MNRPHRWCLNNRHAVFLQRGRTDGAWFRAVVPVLYFFEQAAPMMLK